MNIVLKLLLCISLCTSIFPADTQWAVIGAGPAGITAIGVLLDQGIEPKNITWVDPEFNVGRLGKFYTNVPANVTTECFWEYIESCTFFKKLKTPALQALFNDYDPWLEYPLQNIVDALKEITEHLFEHIHIKKSLLTSLDYEDTIWNVGTEHETFTAINVVLATGSYPVIQKYKECDEIISLDLALDQKKLKSLIEPTDTVAVVGSSHSAILLLKFLSETPVTRIINFYKHLPIYDKDEIGLMGITEWWAKNVLEANPPANLVRVFNNPESRKAWLPLCNKIIYAIGYQRNELPTIEHCDYIAYDDQTGIIGPHLFGLGIAFPETYTDEETGKKIPKVGLLGFMKYAKRIIPEWITYEDNCKNNNKKRYCCYGIGCLTNKEDMIINNY